MSQDTSSYARAGVDINAMDRSLKRVGAMIAATATAGQVRGVGSFGGLFQAPGRDHLLVASTDGVGTKLKVAAVTGRHTSIGKDLVNHCVNDILAQGARPLFFLDYLGTARLDEAVFHDVVKGLCAACRANGCALLGGETAEMPGLYPQGEYDLVGTVVGAVPRSRLITGDDIRAGDVIVGLPSSGLHTNGYSLARRVVFDEQKLAPDDLLPGTRRTVADILLAVHKSYLRPVTAVMETVRVRGIAHLTGGGFIDNIPRILPSTVSAVVQTGSWTTPPVFRYIGERGGIADEEMYRVFNMGIGMILVVRRKDAATAMAALAERRAGARVIGAIEAGDGGVALNA